MSRSEETSGTVTCANCGTDLAGLPAAALCPDCGDSRRHTHLIFMSSVGVSSSVDRSLARPPDPSWREQWRSVLNRLQELEDVYAGILPVPPEWTSLPVDFCKDCFHLKDWIASDTARVPVSAQGPAADRYARQDPAIALAGNVGNTAKHRTRKAGQTKARVARANITDAGTAEFTIEWTEQDGTIGVRDALDLARAAVESWRQFLRAHQMDENGG